MKLLLKIKKFFFKFYCNKCSECPFLKTDFTSFSKIVYTCGKDKQGIEEIVVSENAHVGNCPKLLERTSPCFWAIQLGGFLLLSGFITMVIYDALIEHKIYFVCDLLIILGSGLAGPALMIKSYLLHKKGEL